MDSINYICVFLITYFLNLLSFATCFCNTYTCNLKFAKLIRACSLIPEIFASHQLKLRFTWRVKNRSIICRQAPLRFYDPIPNPSSSRNSLGDGSPPLWAIVLAVSLNQFRVNQTNVASGILKGKQNVRRANSFTAYKFLIFPAKIFYSSELRAAAPLIAIIFMSKYKLNFFGFTRDCRFDVTHTHDGWCGKGAWQGARGSQVGGGHIVTSCECQSS